MHTSVLSLPSHELRQTPSQAVMDDDIVASLSYWESLRWRQRCCCKERHTPEYFIFSTADTQYFIHTHTYGTYIYTYIRYISSVSPLTSFAVWFHSSYLGGIIAVATAVLLQRHIFTVCHAAATTLTTAAAALEQPENSAKLSSCIILFLFLQIYVSQI